MPKLHRISTNNQLYGFDLLNKHEDIKIIKSWIDYDEETGTANQLMYHLQFKDEDTDEWEEAYKAVKFLRLTGVPRVLREQESMIDIFDDCLAALYGNDVDFVHVIARMKKPIETVLFLYGVQGVAYDQEEAIQIAVENYAALTGTLRGSFSQIRFEKLKHEHAEWLREKMYDMKYLHVIRGIPQQRRSAGSQSQSSIMGHTSVPNAEEQLEELVRGIENEFVMVTVASPVAFDDINRWLDNTSKELSVWASEKEGTKSINVGIGMPIVLGGSLGQGENVGTSLSQGESETVGQSFTETSGVSDGVGYSEGLTEGVSRTRGISETVGETYGVSLGESESWGESWGTSRSVTRGRSFTVSEGLSVGESFSQSQSTSESFSETHSQSISQSQSFSDTYGISESQGFSQSTGRNWGESFGQSFGGSFTESDTWSRSHSQGISENRGVSLTEGFSENIGQDFGHGRNTGANLNLNTQLQQSLGLGTGSGLQLKNPLLSFLPNANLSESTSGGSGIGVNLGDNWSEGWSKSLGKTFNLAETHGIGSTRSEGTSYGGSISRGENWGETRSLSEGWSETFSRNQGISRSQGWTFGETYGRSEGISTGRTLGSSTGITVGMSSGRNWSVSQGWSESTTVGESYGRSHTLGVSRTESFSSNISQSESYGESLSRSASESRSVSHSKTESQAHAYSRNKGTSQNTAITHGTSTSRGLNASMTFGPSIGASKSVRWERKDIDNIVRLIEMHRMRLLEMVRTGGWYVDVYLLTPDIETKEQAATLARTAFWGPNVPSPIQVLEPSHEWQEHLKVHAFCFSACTAPERTPDIMEPYAFSTILLPSELAAYTHLPRGEFGGIQTTVERIPLFAVPETKGNLYMGKVISPETGEATGIPYNFNEKALMHTLIAGASGSGKTVSAIRYVHSILKHVGCGAVILDWKMDWRALAEFVEPDKFNFYGLDPYSVRPIEMNIFVPPQYILPTTWRDKVIESMCVAFGLGSKQFGILYKHITEEMYEKDVIRYIRTRDDGTTEVIPKSYETRDGYETIRIPDDGIPEVHPDWEKNIRKVTLATLYTRMRRALENLDPRSRALADSYDSLLTRLEYYVIGELRKLYASTSPNAVRISDFVHGQNVTVLEGGNLDALNKKFIINLFMSGLFLYAKEKYRRNGNKVDHETLIVLEEAHQVIPHNNENLPLDLGENVFEAAFNEARGYGLYLTAIVQVPHVLPPNIPSNCSNLIVHRLGSKEDAEMMTVSLIRDAVRDHRDIPRYLTRLPIGQAVVRQSRVFNVWDAEPVLIAVENLKVPVPSDDVLAELLSRKK